MDNRGNTKNYFLLGVVIVMFALVYGMNHWLNQQIDAAKDQSTNDNSASPSGAVAQSTPESTPGIPVIDPANDPLAPVTQQPKTVKVSTDTEGAKEKSAATVYEFPERNEILPQ